jgi:accessory colonization factor AcfC
MMRSRNADLIFSGSEEMMSDCQIALQGSIDPATIVPLYLRKAAILVRPGNPSHIKGLEDLMKPGHRILVVNGAGQKGLWEDVVGRRGDIASVTKFRANIATVALNSGDARTDGSKTSHWMPGSYGTSGRYRIHRWQRLFQWMKPIRFIAIAESD